MEMDSSGPRLLLEFSEAEVVAQSVVGGAAGDHAFGIFFGGGELVDGVTAVFLQQAEKIRLYAARKDESAVGDFFPLIVAHDGAGLDDGDAVVAACTEGADPDVEMRLRFDKTAVFAEFSLLYFCHEYSLSSTEGRVNDDRCLEGRSPGGNGEGIY